MRSKKMKKILSVALSAVMLGASLFTGNTANAATSEPLIKDMTVAGDAGYIQTFMAADYMSSGKNGFQLKFEYTKLGTVAAQDDAEKDDTEEKDLGYNNTLQFVVFDTSWGGWQPTMIGPNGYDKEGDVTPELKTEYTVDVPFSVIESKLTAGQPVQGINLQTGGVSDCEIKINSLTYADVEEDIKPVESEPVLIEGAWHKTGDEAVDCGTMEVKKGTAYVSVNAWNIGVSNLNLSTFGDPMVAVTVEYGEIADPPIYPQAEVLDASGKPFVENYPQVSEAGEVTYLTPVPKTTWSLTLAYDTCTVKKVQIFDYDESYATEVYDLTNADIIKAMGAGWNLGNALDAVTEDGVVSETAWGNPEVTKYLFKVVSEAGFKTVRIPVSWVDAIKVTGDTYQIDEKRFTELLDRVQTVVDWARDYDLFVIINIQHDGGEGVKGKWLDVTAGNQTGIRAAFADIWSRIANRFAGYDQHLIFESMNEVMESGNYGTPSQTTWNNINFLNQSFVDTVRDAGAHNDVRFLLVPGYNTNIDQTVTDNFKLPTYKGSTDRIMVSVHFYDPYQFTLETGAGSKTEITAFEMLAIQTQFNKLKSKFVDKGIPVVIGEFGAADKNNYTAIERYISEVVRVAKADKLGYIYWDNGYTGEYGMGLWNRYTYAESRLGKTIIPVLTAK
ncbi:MAG: glycoside hydrolase family 5 protein [Lachnospiraceae bacterium]|nr:glycoside hydrolase family 5 protein [Lachnospiraceae bacterium]